MFMNVLVEWMVAERRDAVALASASSIGTDADARHVHSGELHPCTPPPRACWSRSGSPPRSCLEDARAPAEREARERRSASPAAPSHPATSSMPI